MLALNGSEIMKGKTLKQIALEELWTATDEYLAVQHPLDKPRFVAASIRLHLARGGDVSKAAVRASKQQTNNAT